MLAGRTPDNRLYLVSSNEWNAPQTELAYKWFIEKFLPYDEHDTPDSTIAWVKEVSGNPVRDRVINELLLADLGITDIGLITDSGVTTDSENEGGTNKFSLPLEHESKGTQRFFSCIGPWITALEKGGIRFGLLKKNRKALQPSCSHYGIFPSGKANIYAMGICKGVMALFLFWEAIQHGKNKRTKTNRRTASSLRQ